MTTIPGFSGYKFDSSNIKKIEGIKKNIDIQKFMLMEELQTLNMIN